MALLPPWYSARERGALLPEGGDRALRRNWLGTEDSFPNSDCAPEGDTRMEPMTDAQVQALRAEHQAVYRQVKAANVNLVERLQTLDGTAYYDPAEDWFLLSIGEPA